MINKFIEHYDAIVLFNNKTAQMVFQNNPFKLLTNNSIKTYNDLEKFFIDNSNDKTQSPVFDLIEIECKKYLVKRKLIDNNIILFHFESNDYYTNILNDAITKSIIDKLTGCYNKMEMEAVVKRMIASFKRYDNSFFTIVMFDIDFFKKVNDTHGHLAGDFILTELSSLIRKNLRDSDLFGRVGGEEFMLVLPQTKVSGGLKISKKLNTIVSEYKFNHKNTIIPITISLGVTSVSAQDTFETLVQRSDEALYEAKKNGRNRVEYH